MSTEAHPIKVLMTAPSENMRANKLQLKLQKPEQCDCGGCDDEHFLWKEMHVAER
jgi:hypothetical protein